MYGSSIRYYHLLNHAPRSKKKNRIAKIKYVRKRLALKLSYSFFNLAQEIRTPIMLINNPINEIASIENLPENIAQKFLSSKIVLKNFLILQMKFLT